MSDENEIAEALFKIQKWHENRVEQLEMVTKEHTDADIKIGDIEIKAGTDMHRGFRTGIAIALSLLGELPFTITKNN